MLNGPLINWITFAFQESLSLKYYWLSFPVYVAGGFVFPAFDAIESDWVYWSFNILTYFALFCHLEQRIPAKTNINATCRLDFS